MLLATVKMRTSAFVTRNDTDDQIKTDSDQLLVVRRYGTGTALRRFTNTSYIWIYTNHLCVVTVAQVVRQGQTLLTILTHKNSRIHH